MAKMNEDDGSTGSDNRIVPIVSQDTMVQTNYSIPKLTVKTYLPWKKQVEMVLKLKGLSQALTDESVDERVDMQAMLVILGSCDDEHRIQLQSEDTAKKMMNTLEVQYADKSEANKYRLLANYMRATKDRAHSINQHIGKMKDMRALLTDVGEKQSEGAFQVAIIMSLSDEYGDVMKDWDMLHTDMKTTEFLITFLQNREREISLRSQVAFTVKGLKKSDYDSLSIEEKKKVSNCKICKKRGHWGRECPQNPDNACKSNKEKTVAHIALSLGNIAGTLKDRWVLDSGASSHMANDYRMFQHLEMLVTPKTASVGNGEMVEIVGQGTVVIKARTDDGDVWLTLKKVAYIPKLATNLVSVGAAAKRGVKTLFNEDTCAMYNERLQVATGTLIEDGLYLLNFEVESCDDSVHLVRTEDNLKLHQVLGHPCDKVMGDSTVDTGGIIQNLTEGVVNGKCGSCGAGKGTRAVHPSATKELATCVGEKVHLDLGCYGTKVKSCGYYLVCKDEASEYSFVYNMQSKSETLSLIIKMIIEFEFKSGCNIKCIVSDNGSEFVNKRVVLLLLKERIMHLRSSPYCPQQNGVVEREIRTLKEKARTMLIDSGLDLDLAPLAMETACYLKNRLATSRSVSSPYERFTGRKPKLGNLHQFGQQVQVLKNDYITAFEPKTMNGWFVGYTERYNTFKVFIPHLNRTVETSDVIFRDHYPKPLSSDNSDINETISGVSVTLNEERVNEHKDAWEVSSWGEYQSAQDIDVTNTQWHHQSSPVTTKSGKRLVTGQELEDFFENYRLHDKRKEDVELWELTEQHDDSLSEKKKEDAEDLENAPEPPERSSSKALLTRVVSEEPATYVEARTGCNKVQWEQAIQEELKAHEINSTWLVVKTPEQGVKLSAKWVFTIKRDNLGNVEKFKARLVARGFEQRYGIDYQETYAPVSRMETIRTVFSIIAQRRLDFVQFDVSTAFLNGKVEEEIFMEAPEGVDTKPGQCLKLVKALYGLKQAPRAWNAQLNSVLTEIGFHGLESDQCVFTNVDKSILILVYVDDGIIAGRDERACVEIYDQLATRFKLKRLKGDRFVGFEVSKVGQSIYLSQSRYISDVVKRFNLSEAKAVNTPAADAMNVVTNPGVVYEIQNCPYREAVGCLMYVATCSRPDIMFVINWLAKFCTKPAKQHWAGIKQVIMYLKGTADYALCYTPGDDCLAAYSDADHGSPLNDRYSTSGLIIMYSGGPIAFASRKQTAIALSSTESEYIAANEATKELIWAQQLFTELGIMIQKATLYLDNQSTIKQIKNGDTKRRSKHVELRYHYVRKAYQDDKFSLEYVASEKQPADLLTKPLSGNKLKTTIESNGILVTKPKLLSLIVSLLVLIFVSQASCLGFKETDKFVMTWASKHISQGIVLQRVEYAVVSPCSLAHLDSWESEGDVNRKTFESLRKECETFFSEKIITTIRELPECMRNPSNKTFASNIYRTYPRTSRKKRAIPLLGIALAAVTTTVSIGAMAANYMYSEWSPNSSHNRLNEVDKQIDALKRVTDLMQRNSMSTFEVRANIIGNITQLSSKVESNRRAIDQLTKVTASVSWNSARIMYGLERLAEDLRMVQYGCEDRTVPIRTYKERFLIPELHDINDEEVVLQNLEVTKENILIIDFFYDKRPADTHVFKLTPFRYYTNVTTTPRLIEYVGPRMIIFNETNNCRLGVDESDFAHGITRKTCSIPDFYDDRLSNWKTVEGPDQDKVEPPQIFTSNLYVYIYCMYHHITIFDRTILCPHYPFEIRKDTRFSLPNVTYEVHSLNVNRAHSSVKIMPPELEIQSFYTNYARETEALQALKEKNDRTLQAGIFTYDKNTITISWNISTAIYVMGIVATCITIGSFIQKLVRRDQEDHPSETRVNIINEPQVISDLVASPKAPPAELYKEYKYPSMTMEKIRTFKNNDYIPVIQVTAEDESIYDTPKH